MLSLIPFVKNQDNISSLFVFDSTHSPVLKAVNNENALFFPLISKFIDSFCSGSRVEINTQKNLEHISLIHAVLIIGR